MTAADDPTIRYRLAAEAGGIGTFDWDLVTGRLAWDERLIELFGYDTDTFTESIEAFNARLHPDDLPDVTVALQNAVDTVGVFDAEYRLLLPDGTQRWIGARGHAIAGPAGAAVRLLGAAYDTTDRRTAEARIAAVLETMTTAFFSLDRNWRFSYVNAEATKLLGLTRDELVGAVIWELFPAAVDTEFESHYRHAMATGEPVSFDAFYPEPLNAWYEVRASHTPDGLAVYFVDVTARRRLQQESERAAARADLLNRITVELVGTLDHGEAAERLANLVVPSLADWCIVTLVGDGDTAGRRDGLRDVGVRHHDPAMQRVASDYAAARLSEMVEDSLVVSVIETGVAQHIHGDAVERIQAMFSPGRARELIGELTPDAVVVLPLIGPAGSVGMLSLINGRERGDFTVSDLVTARHVAARAGLVLDNARLYRQQRELAETLQRSMLSAPVEPDHCEIVVRYVPAGRDAQVGGDWYDAFLQDDGATIVTIGDVSGHDITAAATMGQLRSVLRGVAVSTGAGPAAILRDVDHAMTTLQIRTTATAVAGRLEQTPEELTRGVTRFRWSNAGHPPPLLITPSGRVDWLLAAEPEILLGLGWESERTETVREIDRGSMILLYTDGLIERRDENIDVGLQRLQDAVAELAAELPDDGTGLAELCDALLARMLSDEPQDDIALLAVRLHPQDRPRPAAAGPVSVPPNVPRDPATS